MASTGCQVSPPTYRDSGRTYLIHVSPLSVWDIEPSKVTGHLNNEQTCEDSDDTC